MAVRTVFASGMAGARALTTGVTRLRECGDWARSRVRRDLALSASDWALRRLRSEERVRGLSALL